MKTVKILAIIFAAVAAVCVIPYQIIFRDGDFEYRSILLGIKRTDGFMDIAVPGSDIDG